MGSPEHLARLKEVLLTALGLSGDERRDYLDSVGKTDNSLRSEAEGLLAHERDIPEVVGGTGELVRLVETLRDKSSQ